MEPMCWTCKFVSVITCTVENTEYIDVICAEPESEYCQKPVSPKWFCERHVEVTNLVKG